MNKGLVTGVVYNSAGRPVPNTYVRMMRLMGSMGRIALKGLKNNEADTYTDSRGRFSIPFFWSGAEFAEGITTAQATVISFTENASATGKPMTASGKAQFTVHLYKDIKALMGPSSPLLSNTDLQYYVPQIASSLKKYLSGRFWNTGLLTTENWILIAAGEIQINPFPQRELEYGEGMSYELIPEIDPTPNSNNKAFEEQICSCQKAASLKQGIQGDPATGWEKDNESFTVHTANYHLYHFYKTKDVVQKVIGCCIDTDFFIRRCEFITAANVKGAVIWIPTSKRVGISVCFNSKKKISWYRYFIDNAGRLHLKLVSSLRNSVTC